MARTAAIGIRVEPPVKEALEKLAAADRRTLAAYIEILLVEHIESKAPQKKLGSKAPR
jgi:hypothetical protein